jgi:outer membrane protein OmpA-like peptidoglycan-associated protein
LDVQLGHVRGMLGFSQVNTIHKDTLIIYYESNKYKVTASSEKKIKQKFLGKRVKSVEIYGYADYVGRNEFNDNLALKRAKRVSDFIEKYRSVDVMNIISMGETHSIQNSTNPPKGVLEDRKVVCYINYIDVAENKTSEIELEVSSKNYLEQLNILKIGESILFKNILFYLGKAVMIPSSFPELELLLQTLKNNPDLHIEIRGNVCCGSYDEIENKSKYKNEDDDVQEEVLNTYHYDYNKTLSLNRAETIKRHLVYKGIDSERIITKGMGFSNPLHFPESDEEDKLLNRRIELVVIKN